jgi:DNA-binding CsgD family transcriptional regulator
MMEPSTRATDWVAFRSQLKGNLSSEQLRILDLLIEGKTQPEIAQQLSLHRSAVWRRIKKLRICLDRE